MLITGSGRRGVHKRSGGTVVKPSFSLPLSDAGAGAVNLNTLIALGSRTATFTRATTAWTKLSTGLWASVATGVARSSYLGANSAVGAYGGYLAEGARTNLLLQSNDFTNAAWAKVTMTTAMTSTGPDGVVNSATRLTASGALSTILQVLAAAASDRTWSVWVRRVTGTGTIKLFQGATKTADLSASLNTNTYTQISQDASVDVTLLGVGIEIGTSTDAIDVWCGQFEAGAFASTPIPTTTVAVTRNADVLTYPSSGNISDTVGTVYAEVTTQWSSSTGTTHDILTVINGDISTLWVGAENATGIRIIDSPQTHNLLVTGNDPSTAMRKRASSWGGSAMAVSADGVITTGAFTGSMGTGASISIGNNTAGTQPWSGTIRNLHIYPAALSAAQLQAMTT